MKLTPETLSTVLQGAVALWRDDTGIAQVIASRRGVKILTYLHDIDPPILDAAKKAHSLLTADPNADLSWIHRTGKDKK